MVQPRTRSVPPVVITNCNSRSVLCVAWVPTPPPSIHFLQGDPHPAETGGTMASNPPCQTPTELSNHTFPLILMSELSVWSVPKGDGMVRTRPGVFLLDMGARASEPARMDVSELTLAPRIKGRAAVPISTELVRELAPADFALLASERGSAETRPIAKLRDRHHALARCLAQGMKNNEAAAITGYDPSRISILKADPTFRELVEQYSRVEDSVMADFTDRATTLSLSAMNEIQDRLEDDPETFSVPTLLEVAKFAADRTGHAPISKNVNVNVNAGLGDRLAQARKRLAIASAASGIEVVGVDDVE